MFASHNTAAAYARIGIETGIAGADPHQLVLMLFDGALLATSAATLHMRRKETAAKGQAISRAIDIITNGLKASLDFEAGGGLAQKLGALYDYLSARLLYANVHNNTAALDEVSHLLMELKGAWEEIGKKKIPAALSVVAA